MQKTIKNIKQFIELWTGIYKTDRKPDWSCILPYYHEDIYFRDSIQEIRGIKDFAAMTKRLSERSKNLEFIIHHKTMEQNIIFMEWEMVLSFKRYPKSSIYGASRITLTEEGKIIQQRDYYDLWGDIFDNIPFFKKSYRKFMRKIFG